MGRAAAVLALGTALVSSAIAEDSPLERLNKRSADARWKEARNQWIPAEQQGVEKQLRNQLPVITPSTASPLKETELESPELDTTLLDEKSVFDTPAPLFEPLIPNASAELLDESPPVRMSAKPFPTESSSDLASPARSLRVPDPYQAILEKTNEAEASVPNVLPLPEPQEAGLFRLAQRGAGLPPAPESDSRKPVLRSISEIQPFHDYSSPKAEGEEPGFAAGQEKTKPTFLSLPHSGSLEKNAPPTHYHWMASNLTHDPLYFEDLALERYGHTYPCMQPLVSVSKFGLQVAGLPYQIALNPVNCEQYALGNYRPGDCPPFLRYRIPFNKTAATTAAGVYTGLIFLLP